MSKRMRNLPRHIVFSLLVVLMSAGAGKNADSAQKTPKSGASKPVETKSIPAVSRLALEVANQGALRCVERADQLAKFFGRGENEVSIVDKSMGASSIDLVSATLLVPTEGRNYSTVDISLVPTANGCTASYSATVYVAESCAQSEKKYYGDLTFKPLGRVPYRLALIGSNARVLSKELPGGCMFTKHEVIR